MSTSTITSITNAITATTTTTTTTAAATTDTTTPPVRRHSLVHRHSSAAYAMEHAPILTHPALDTVDKPSVPPLPPRTYKSSGSGSTDSLSSDSCSPAQNKRSNNLSNNLSNSDSEPEEAFIPLAKPSMRFKVDVSQWKAPYGTLPSSSSDGLQQTSIPEENEMVLQQSLSSSPPPLPPKPSQPSSCTCTCHAHPHPHHHHHHDQQHKTTSKKRRHRHSRVSMHDGRRGSDQLSLTPQSSLTSHSSVNSQLSFGSDTSGIQEDHEFDSALAMLNDAFQSLSTAATSIGRTEHIGRSHGSFQIDFSAIPSQQKKPAEYLEPINSSPQPHHKSHDTTYQLSSSNAVTNMPPKSSRSLCRLYPPSFVTTSNSSTVFANHVRHH